MEAGNTIDELMAQLGGGDDALTSPYDAYGGSEVGKREGGGKTYVWQQTESSITVAALAKPALRCAASPPRALPSLTQPLPTQSSTAIITAFNGATRAQNCS